jgi:hypothetical protein
MGASGRETGDLWEGEKTPHSGDSRDSVYAVVVFAPGMPGSRSHLLYKVALDTLGGGVGVGGVFCGRDLGCFGTLVGEWGGCDSRGWSFGWRG